VILGTIMTATYPDEIEKTSARTLLGSAVHRSRAVSVEGLLERLFTHFFNGLVYSQIWEDPAVDMEAMAIEPHHHLVAIASGGCNVLSYLTANPAKITAVDLSRAHVALVNLKLAGLRHLPGWDDYYRFFGEADESRNTANYRKYLRAAVDARTRKYWESRTLLGRRRLSLFSTNIYRKGLLGRFIGLGHIVARAYGRDMKGLLQARSIAEQNRFFDSEIAPLFDRKLVRWFTGHRVSLFGLGIPPAQYEALAGGIPMSLVLRDRLRKLACDFPLRENYFAWQAFGRSYAPGAVGPLPPYLQERNFGDLRARAKIVEVHHASLTDTLDAMAPGSAHRFVLLDAQDWMTDAQLNALWTAITRVAAAGSRVIFRTAGKHTILPGRVAKELLDHWSYQEQRSADLNLRDRSGIYGGFHIYERAANH
jgi:S-adenosylmethionine-diacylglycerol 3-amino-3-carboxypropyl transferase